MPILRNAKTGKLNMLGFTLFTAMVSFIVIGIGVVVIQHMINSEQNYSQIISALLNQQEMDSTKDIIRLDALQVFNLVYRAKFFEYFDANFSPGQSNGGYTDVGLDKPDWQAYQKDFTCELFFGDVGGQVCNGSRFSVYVANKIIGLLYEYSGYFKGQTYWFRIYDYSWQKSMPIPLDITSPTTTPSITQTQFTNALSQGLIGAKNAGKFTLLIGCDETDQSKCGNGSFYTNIDLYNIDKSLYLNLPRVFLKRTYDDSSVDDAILPNNIISFFIPMRLYGALAFTREQLSSINFKSYNDKTFGEIMKKQCGEFDGVSSGDLSIPSLESQGFLEQKSQLEIQTEITKDIKNLIDNKEINGFVIKVDDVVIVELFYPSKEFKLVVNGGPNVPALIEQKIDLLRVKVSVIDKNPFYSFGHASTMVFKFSGAGEVQLPSPTILENCSCSVAGPGQDLTGCAS